jgi:hypothetical protein
VLSVARRAARRDMVVLSCDSVIFVLDCEGARRGVAAGALAAPLVIQGRATWLRSVGRGIVAKSDFRPGTPPPSRSKPMGKRTSRASLHHRNHTGGEPADRRNWRRSCAHGARGTDAAALAADKRSRRESVQALPFPLTSILPRPPLDTTPCPALRLRAGGFPRSLGRKESPPASKDRSGRNRRVRPHVSVVKGGSGPCRRRHSCWR